MADVEILLGEAVANGLRGYLVVQGFVRICLDVAKAFVDCLWRWECEKDAVCSAEVWEAGVEDRFEG